MFSDQNQYHCGVNKNYKYDESDEEEVNKTLKKKR